MVRRAIAAGAGLVVLILLVLGAKSCLGAREDRAIKDYVRETGALVQESDQLSNQLFKLISNRQGSDAAVANALNTYRQQAEQLTDRARATDTPDEMSSTQRYLVESFELRQEGVKGIADEVPNAITRQERRQGTNRVAQDMQEFLASDVIYAKRVVIKLRAALEKQGLADQTQIPQSQFLPSIEWLQPSFVADQISGIRTGSTGQSASPGLHGTGLATVTVGGQTLQPGASATLQAAGKPEVDVQVANQGENTETDVNVKVTVGKGKDAVNAQQPLATIGAGETKTVKVALPDTPPTGQNVPITVEVEPVAGEKKTDNNKQEYMAIFTR